MLQQILDKMEVDPELLAELGDEHKQELFHRIREEQVRKWKLRDMEQQLSRSPPRPGQKRVHFLLGSDGEPMVAVIGYQEDEQPSKQKNVSKEQTWSTSEVLNHFQFLSEYTSDEDFLNASELEQYDSGHSDAGSSSQEEDASWSIGEPKHHSTPTKEAAVQMREGRYNIGGTLTSSNPRNSSDFALKRNGQQFMDINDEEFSRNLAHDERELFKSLQTVKMEVEKLEKRILQRESSQESTSTGDDDLGICEETNQCSIHNPKSKCWEERCSIKNLRNTQRDEDSQDNEVKKQIEDLARKAREKHRHSLNQIISANRIPTVTHLKPPSRTATLEWFKAHEAPKRVGMEPNHDKISPWFHGLISRTDAEDRLKGSANGTFLVRISERIWGYAISFQDGERCKHFLVESTNNRYRFFPTSHHGSYSSLWGLIDYHGSRPITDEKQEMLLKPCLRLHTSQELLDLYRGVEGIRLTRL